MADIILESFPFDSMEVLNEESSQMEADREYEAEVFRKYFKKFLSNGVYYGHYKNYGENSMKVTADGGMNIRVSTGAGIIEGADFENTEERIITLDRPVSGNRVDRIVVQFNASLDTRSTKIIVKQGTGEVVTELKRNDNIYEICIAEVTVRSISNITYEDIKDTRLDKNLCGIVNSLISVDGEELYQKFQDYIDTVTENLVRKDEENITISGIFKDANGGTSKNNFTDAYKTKLDGIATGATKVVVNNTLTSTSTTEALSAAMGKKLNDEKQKKIVYGTSIPSRRKQWRYLYSIFLIFKKGENYGSKFKW